MLQTLSFAGRPTGTGLSPLSCAGPLWPRLCPTVACLTGRCGAAVPSRRRGRHWRHSAELSHDGTRTPSCHQNDTPTPRPPSRRNVWGRCSRRNTVLLHVRVRMLSSRRAVARVAATTTSSSYRRVRDRYQSSAVAPSCAGLLRIVVPSSEGPQSRC